MPKPIWRENDKWGMGADADGNIVTFDVKEYLRRKAIRDREEAALEPPNNPPSDIDNW